MALAGLCKEMAEVSAKSQSAAKRKMAGWPSLSKVELLKVRELDAKPQWLCQSAGPVCSAVAQRGASHEYVWRFRDKEKFTDVMLDDLAPLMDSDAADTEVWCLESMNDEEIDRLKAFVLAVWMFTLMSLSSYRSKRGLDPKGTANQRKAEDDEPSLPARSQGCTGAAEEELVARKLVAMKTKLRIEGDRALYTTKLGAELMDVTSARVTARRACKSAGRGVKHHWFQTLWLRAALPSRMQGDRILKRRGGLFAGCPLGRGRRGVAPGMGSVARVVEGE